LKVRFFAESNSNNATGEAVELRAMKTFSREAFDFLMQILHQKPSQSIRKFSSRGLESFVFYPQQTASSASNNIGKLRAKGIFMINWCGKSLT
jgi:hypothetical protein